MASLTPGAVAGSQTSQGTRAQGSQTSHGTRAQGSQTSHGTRAQGKAGMRTQGSQSTTGTSNICRQLRSCADLEGHWYSAQPLGMGYINIRR